MQIQNSSLERLIPYAANARTHSDEQIAAFIREFGFNNPVLIDRAAAASAATAGPLPPGSWG